MEEERKEVNSKMETESNKNARATKKEQSKKKSLGQKILEIDEEEFGQKVEDKLNSFTYFIQKILKSDIRTPEGRKKGKEWLGILGSAIAVIFLGMFLNANFTNAGKEYMNLVKNGSPAAYEKMTYDEVFGTIFNNKKWEYVGKDDGDNPIVQFNGKIKNTNSSACIQFRIDVDSETFVPAYMDIDGEMMPILEAQTEVMSIFDYAYTQKGYQSQQQQSYSSNGGDLEGLYDQMFGGMEDAMVDAYVNRTNNNQQKKEPAPTTQAEPETVPYASEIEASPIQAACNYYAWNGGYHSFYSPSTGYFLIPIWDEENPAIAFTVENTTANYATVYYVDCETSEATNNNYRMGLIYQGLLYTASKEDTESIGNIKLVWKDVDHVSVELINGDEIDKDMVTDDYVYFGNVDNGTYTPIQ
ncbi:MAG: hypothetical protein LBS02_07750 [Hungatella sp.]|nr:hypothetical protein [Hungatella sp.]